MISLVQTREERLETKRRYRISHKDERSEYDKAYALRRLNDPILHQRRLETQMRYRKSHKKQISDYTSEYNKRPSTRILKHKVDKTYRDQYTNIVINYYSNETYICAICGENEYKFLTIDHCYGGGRKQRKEDKSYGSRFHQWLVANDFPTGYEVLCYNCNCSKDRVYRYQDYLNKRIDAISYYSGGSNKCMCCGEEKFECLTIDHIDNDGNVKRKLYQILGGSQMYYWLYKNNYPDGLQTLCYNCNCGKTRNYGVCPHKTIPQLITA